MFWSKDNLKTMNWRHLITYNHHYWFVMSISFSLATNRLSSFFPSVFSLRWISNDRRAVPVTAGVLEYLHLFNHCLASCDWVIVYLAQLRPFCIFPSLSAFIHSFYNCSQNLHFSITLKQGLPSRILLFHGNLTFLSPFDSTLARFRNWCAKEIDQKWWQLITKKSL